MSSFATSFFVFWMDGSINQSIVLYGSHIVSNNEIVMQVLDSRQVECPLAGVYIADIRYHFWFGLSAWKFLFRLFS